MSVVHPARRATRAGNVDREWVGRPALASVVRAAVLIVPIALAFAASAMVQWALPAPKNTGDRWMQWSLLLGVAVGTLVVTDRLARRLLPLATLLKLALVFPDRAPSRFRIALRAGTVRQLEKRVAAVRHEGLGEDPGIAAATVVELAAALNAHDSRTRGHSERVRALTDLVAEEMRLDPEDRERLRWGALLHDVGKLMVHPDVLNKVEALNDEEWELLRQHPLEGERLTKPLAAWLGPWTGGIGEHHERWDGGGYPRGLQGEEISLGARIVAVADAFEVMTAPRSYKKPIGARAARAELVQKAGSQFDPAVVRAFLNVSLGRVYLASGLVGWIAQVPSLSRIPLTPVAGSTTAAVATAAAVLGTGLAHLPDVPVTEAPPVVLGVTEDRDDGASDAGDEDKDRGKKGKASAAGTGKGWAEANRGHGRQISAQHRNENAATPATPAVRADPGEPGDGATPATPAIPATPSKQAGGEDEGKGKSGDHGPPSTAFVDEPPGHARGGG